MFAALAAYKKLYGDCSVPAQWKDNPRLATWCATRRNAYRKNKLAVDLVRRLEQLGFEWDPHAAAWEEKLSLLAAYKQAHGDCDVPPTWNENPKLSNWCDMQKQYYKKGKLPPDRVKRLKELGFRFEVREPKKK